MQKRGLAIVAAGVVLLAHLISLRHETTVAHVRDSAGVLAHAHELSEFHAHSPTPHLHGSDAEDHADLGPCGLLVGLEQSTILANAPAIIASTPSVELSIDGVSPATVAGLAILAFAPKTSPPIV